MAVQCWECKRYFCEDCVVDACRECGLPICHEYGRLGLDTCYSAHVQNCSQIQHTEQFPIGMQPWCEKCPSLIDAGITHRCENCEGRQCLNDKCTSQLATSMCCHRDLCLMRCAEFMPERGVVCRVDQICQRNSPQACMAISSHGIGPQNHGVYGIGGASDSDESSGPPGSVDSGESSSPPGLVDSNVVHVFVDPATGFFDDTVSDGRSGTSADSLSSSGFFHRPGPAEAHGTIVAPMDVED